jgi:hypothetical protein
MLFARCFGRSDSAGPLVNGRRRIGLLMHVSGPLCSLGHEGSHTVYWLKSAETAARNTF